MLVTKTNAFSTDFVDFHGASYWSSASELVAGVGGMGRLFTCYSGHSDPKVDLSGSAS